MSQTTYVLDTSVLLQAGRTALYSFDNGEVVIPLAVLKEVEAKRNDPELGLAARSVLRELNDLRLKGDIREGVPAGSSTLRVEINHVSGVPAEIRKYLIESKPVTVAYMLRKNDGKNAVLVTKDVSLRIMADLVGVPSQDFVPVNVQNDFIDTLAIHHISDEELDTLYSEGTIRLDIDVPINVAVNLRAPKGTALVISAKGYHFKLIQSKKIYDLESKNAEQAVATHYLTDPSIKIVSLGGRAGTGKTTLALAAGLEQVDNNVYKKVTVFRSMHAVGGEELGFLPGTEAEKLDPWLAAIYDSLSSFLPPQKINYYKSNGSIEVLPLTHIRGRNLSKRFILIDEAQNLSRETIMTALTRSGQGTKAVMSWDVSQRDNIRVGRHDGVYEVTSRLLGEPLFAHISLQKSQRSDVAELVSHKLDDY